MRQMLGELGAFWRRPANAKYTLLVVAAAFVLMLCHWDARHDAASHRFVSQGVLRSKEWRSLVRNEAGAVAGALGVWTLVSIAAARRRRQPLEVALARTALAFGPGLLAGLGVATDLLGCDRNLASAIEALAGAWVAGLLWAELGLWPVRAAEAEPRPPRFYRRILVVSVAAYAALFAWLCIARYRTYYAALNDLGMYTQQLWGNLHGHWFLCSTYQLEGDTMLAEHFMPLVALLTPFYALWQDPRMLLIVQAVAVALAALPLYGIAVRLGLDRRVGLLFAGSYLLHPLLQTATLYDFHPDAFVPLFGAGAFWALFELDHSLQNRQKGECDDRSVPWRHTVVYFVFVLLWLSYKEDSMFGVAMLGIYALVFRRRWALGGVTVLVAVAWGVIAMGVIIPHFRVASYSHVDRYYHLLEPFGWTPDQGSFFVAFLKTALLHPFYMLGQVLNAPRVLALLKLFGPVALLSWMGPKELLIAAPALALNLLSDGYEQYEFRLHYPFGAMPFVYVSALVGTRNLGMRLSKRKTRRSDGKAAAMESAARSARLALGAGAFVAALFLCRWFGETPLSRPFAEEKVWRKDHHRRADAFVRLVPADASVSAQTGLGAHLTHRLVIVEFPYLERDPPPEYIILDAKAPTWPLSEKDYLTRVTALLGEGTYGVVEADDGLLLLRRGHPATRNDEARQMVERIL